MLEGSTVPFGATNLNTVDPVTGLEEYTYDPTGALAFNPADVNREGVIDLNDAFIVDEYNGYSYENLTQSLDATAQTPVTGAIEPISLVNVQLVDGESAIGSADLAVENAALTGVGNTNFYSFNLQKTGPGTVTWARTGGTVTVYPNATLEISDGILQIGGSEDPFTDNNAGGAGSTAGNHVAVTVDGTGELQFIGTAGTNYTVAGLTINNNTTVDLGTNKLFIDYGAAINDPIAAIKTYLTSGYNGGSWNGPGIDSSAAAANSQHYAVGYADSSDPGNPAGIPSGELEVRYTLYGDTNLDGSVNSVDFGALAANFGESGKNWDQGAFTYNGTVNSVDFGLLAQNFGQSIGGGSVVTAADWAALDAFAAANGLLSEVPEPTSAGIIALGVMGALARRRRK